MIPSKTKTPKVIEPAKATAVEKGKLSLGPITTAVTLFITLSVPILYVIGRVYVEAYLNTYGVVNDLFEHSTQDYLYSALIGLFYRLFNVYSTFTLQWKPLLIIAFYVSLGIFGYFVIWEMETSDTKGWLSEKPFLRGVIRALLAGALTIPVIYFVISALLLIMALPLSMGQSAGKEVAVQEIANDKGACETQIRKDPAACIQVIKNDKPVIVGRIIAVSSSHVAIAKDGKATILAKDGLSFEVMK